MEAVHHSKTLVIFYQATWYHIPELVFFLIQDIYVRTVYNYSCYFSLFCRQYLDVHGLYDREKLFWKDIEDVIIAAACAPPGGGRNPLTPRFVRHFGMLLIPSPDEIILKHIFKVCRIRGYNNSCPYRELCDTDKFFYMTIHFY